MINLPRCWWQERQIWVTDLAHWQGSCTSLDEVELVGKEFPLLMTWYQSQWRLKPYPNAFHDRPYWTSVDEELLLLNQGSHHGAKLIMLWRPRFVVAKLLVLSAIEAALLKPTFLVVLGFNLYHKGPAVIIFCLASLHYIRGIAEIKSYRNSRVRHFLTYVPPLIEPHKINWTNGCCRRSPPHKPKIALPLMPCQLKIVASLPHRLILHLNLRFQLRAKNSPAIIINHNPQIKQIKIPQNSLIWILSQIHKFNPYRFERKRWSRESFTIWIKRNATRWIPIYESFTICFTTNIKQ